MKKILFLVTVISISFGVFFCNQVKAELNLTAESAVLMDVDSGRILYAYNETEQQKIASTTKVMTALLAIENSELDEQVIISEQAASVEGSSIYLEQGEVIVMEDLLYGLMLDSGNDAAHAISEHIAGSVSEFADMMTNRARDLGAKLTSLQNPHGLPSENHHSTAKDITNITRHALKNPVFNKIVSTEVMEIPRDAKDKGIPETQRLINDNDLLFDVDEADGVKTGWTEKAGRCLVFSGTKGDRQIVGTVLNAPSMYEDAHQLLNYGFDNYQEYNLIQRGQLIRTMPVKGGKPEDVSLIAAREVILPLTNQELTKLSYNLSLTNQLTPPLKKHNRVGKLQVVINNRIETEISILTGYEISKKYFWDFF